MIRKTLQEYINVPSVRGTNNYLNQHTIYHHVEFNSDRYLGIRFIIFTLEQPYNDLVDYVPFINLGYKVITTTNSYRGYYHLIDLETNEIYVCNTIKACHDHILNVFNKCTVTTPYILCDYNLIRNYFNNMIEV